MTSEGLFFNVMKAEKRGKQAESIFTCLYSLKREEEGEFLKNCLSHEQSGFDSYVE